MRKVFLAVAATAALVGCDARLKVESKTTGEPVSVLVKNDIGATVPITISEVCYDGVLYLVNSKGGMAPKVDRMSAYPSYDKTPRQYFTKC